MHKEQYGVYLLVRGDEPDYSFRSYSKTMSGVIADVAQHLTDERLHRTPLFEGEMTCAVKEADLYLNMGSVINEMTNVELKVIQMVPEAMTKDIDLCIAWIEDKNNRSDRDYQVIDHDISVFEARLNFEIARLLDRRFYSNQDKGEFDALDRELTIRAILIGVYKYSVRNSLTAAQHNELVKQMMADHAEKLKT